MPHDSFDRYRYNRRVTVRDLRQIILVIALISIVLLITCVMLAFKLRSVKKSESVLPAVHIEQSTLSAEVVPIVSKPEKPAQKRVEKERNTYFRDDIPLGVFEQRLLYSAAEEFGVPYTLALAVVERETNYRNITGDGGDSIGYMQVQPRWHSERMEEIGAYDLTDPKDNFRTGCSYLGELLSKYDGDETNALTAYNSGKGGTSRYASAVLEIWERLG